MPAVKFFLYFLRLALLLGSATTSFSSGSLVLVLDDIGNQRTAGRDAIDIPWVTTVAIMPGRPFSKELAEYAYSLDKEIIIHAPMANTTDFPLGPLGLDRRDGQEQLLVNLKQAVASVPHAIGLSNHMGSQLTQDREAMGWIMAELRRLGFYFFDSRTVASTVAWQVAQEMHVPWSMRHIFLDHYQTADFIAGQWQKALARAAQGETVTVICHPYPATVKFLSELVLTDSEAAYLVPLSDVLNYAFLQRVMRNVPQGT